MTTQSQAGLGPRVRAVTLALTVGLTVALTVFLGPLGCVHTHEHAPEAIRAAALATVGEARGESPGLVVATVQRPTGAEPGAELEITSEAGGFASLAEGRAATTATPFLWFSITKLFTATAILQLHERGQLDIDAPVEDVLGAEWTIVAPRGRSVTARDLLSHSSGLANPSVWDAAYRAGHTRRSVAEQLAALLERHGPKLRHRPGQSQGYSNLGYLTLGRMIELADGRDYETYVREEILEVLGMDHTAFTWAPLVDAAASEPEAQPALGHSRRGGFWTNVAKSVANPEVFGPTLPRWLTTTTFEVEGAPYGGLIGTAGDLGKFLAAHLQHGEWQGRRILSPASVQAMQTVQRDDKGRSFDFALGWHTQLIDGERYFNHMGKGGGYRPAVRIWPGRRYGVVILTNRTRYDPRPLTQMVPPRLELDPTGT